MDHRVKQFGTLCIATTLIEFGLSRYRLPEAVDVVAMPSTWFEKQTVEFLLLGGPPGTTDARS